jgi:hypothetical protein
VPALTLRNTSGMLARLALLLALSGPPFQDIAKWNLICYCDATAATPHSIVRMDDNGVILFALRSGGTLEDLRRAGVAATQSQLSLLQAWQLLHRRGELYTTAMPLIDDSTERAIHAFVDPLALDFERSHAPGIRALAASIAAAGLPHNQYAVLFSYVLDGQTWKKLDADGAVLPTKPDLLHPFWNGAFWAVQTARQVPGTNTSTVLGVTTYRTWNDLVGKAVSAYPMDRFPPRSFPDKPGTTVHDQGKSLADAVAAVIETATARAAFPALRESEHSVATLILGHEIIWTLMDRIVRDGIVEKPTALSEPNATPSEVGALIFRTTP